MDERNHGNSETHHSNDMSPAAQSADIRGVVEAIGLDRYVLVGMSMGGLNGIAYAARYPEGLAAMVLVGRRPDGAQGRRPTDHRFQQAAPVSIVRGGCRGGGAL